eukprot:7498746-Prorocentrum_lima.AAC.1
MEWDTADQHPRIDKLCWKVGLMYGAVRALVACSSSHRTPIARHLGQARVRIASANHEGSNKP